MCIGAAAGTGSMQYQLYCDTSRCDLKTAIWRRSPWHAFASAGKGVMASASSDTRMLGQDRMNQYCGVEAALAVKETESILPTYI